MQSHNCAILTGSLPLSVDTKLSGSFTGAAIWTEPSISTWIFFPLCISLQRPGEQVKIKMKLKQKSCYARYQITPKNQQPIINRGGMITPGSKSKKAVSAQGKKWSSHLTRGVIRVHALGHMAFDSPESSRAWPDSQLLSVPEGKMPKQEPIW